MGAGLYAYYKLSKFPRKIKKDNFSVYLGPEFSKSEIGEVLKNNNLDFEWYQSEKKLLEIVSRLLFEQKIIGWFQGRMEWGPRALGNRSILASAAKEEMKDIINSKVKHREMFRPFAPVIPEEDVKKYLKIDKNISPSIKYMLFVYPFKKEGLKKAKATVHVNGTGRVQTITRKDNPRYYRLLKVYEKLSKVPILVNTSFNVRGEPIVTTPEDAVNCFLKTEIDYLVIDKFLVRKSKK